MTTVRASAPGKAVLSGEYVVLDGASAISVALSRRVQVTISATARNYHEITAPGLNENLWRFEANNNGQLRWHDAAGADMFKLLACVWRIVLPATSAGLSVRIDSSRFKDSKTGMKLGLGSSAAVATSLVAALNRFCASPRDDSPGDRRAAILSLASAAHAEFQGGLGSGVDIATSVRGGVIEFRPDAGRSTIALSWPEGLISRFLWSGSSATTTDRLERYEDARRKAGTDQARVALTKMARVVASKWSAGSAADILISLAEYTDSLQEFSDAYDLGVFAAGHGGLSGLASECGIVYKPCGAGGGDIGVAMALDESSMSEFCERSELQGFTALDVLPDSQGIVVEVENNH